ncbi:MULTISPECIES: nickel/cobalt ABC transporter permease [Paenibacillus]|uniref:Nickel transporter permease NikB n=1 Tax=Paenibacillus naphthalenovorans TaxID=162209 RepID=A0A0U2VQ18_9BACL|nr:MULTISPECIES: nickel/cobalt ABC transporter permease [Paenibacillus]ALS22870.1 nickel transporter permease NikB [Paenibacillus naphthalenovorans]NTZ17531.1 ABC transporter permease [Paenibacillus sp. JMULE4]GCL74863.1 ABC transporter permease [Paenibacillus naphthalenovorans]SDJ70182.1 nickel transport system permease protein [Paenibacillus naphthalenovorans]
MAGYALKRLFVVVPLLVVISFMTFILNGLSPMDPAEVVLHAQGVPAITDELIAETREALGMNRPLLIRYWDWLVSCLRLDFGDSYITGKPVWSLLGPALLNTLKLTLVSSLLIILLSIALGVGCALREGKWLDLSVRSFSFLLTSMPSYWLAALMVWYFSVKLDLLPTSGMDGYGSYVLPVAVIVIGYAGIYFRIIRSSMLSNLNEDYVLYGRACGLSERSLTLQVLRNSLQVAVSVFGLAIPVILGSTVVVENIFAWPGLGTLTVNSILGRDFPIIQAYVLVLAVAFVLFNTASDLLNAAVNPKLRKEF